MENYKAECFSVSELERYKKRIKNEARFWDVIAAVIFILLIVAVGFMTSQVG